MDKIIYFGRKVVIAKVRLRQKWLYNGNGEKENKRKELAMERLHNSGHMLIYRRKVKE